MAAPAVAYAAATAIGGSDPITFDAEAALADLPQAPPGIRVQPPHTQGARDVIAICNGTAPSHHRIDVVLRQYRTEFELFLSPIQQVWQCGEFIRIALDTGRYNEAATVAATFLKETVIPPQYAGGPRLLFPSKTYYTAIADVLDHPRHIHLLLLGLYLPLCPDPTDSLALFRSIAAAVAPDLGGMPWFLPVVCSNEGKLYMPFGAPETEQDWTWWHFARRADTYHKLAWLMGPQSPVVPFWWTNGMSSPDDMRRAIWSFKLQLALIPSLGYQRLIVDGFLRHAKRATLLCFKKRDIFEIPCLHESIYARVSHHLDVDAPETVLLSYVGTITITQRIVVNEITKAFVNTCSGDYDANITSLIMDYVRRDESVATDPSNPDRSTRTPYQKREAAYAVSRKTRAEEKRAEAHVAADPPRAAAAAEAAAATHPHEEEEGAGAAAGGDEGEPRKRQRI